MNEKVRDLLKSQVYVNGQWIEANSGKRFEVLNPSTGEVVGSCPDMDATEVAKAIDAANIALEHWKRTTAKERSNLLRKWYDLVMQYQEELAILMTLEQGKVLKESIGEISYGASFIEWFAEEAKRTYGDVIPTTANDRRLVTIKQPVGVVSAITPWNFPNAMITRKAAPALAAGCTIVLKPARETPLSALALAELAHRAGIPKGVFNVVTSTQSREVGYELTTNPVVRKVTFTGSTPVGKVLMSQSVGTVKKVSMELGGNAPVIVFDDADLEKAVEGAIASKYRNSGQTCICANRILVQASIYDEFVKIFTQKVKALQLGDGLDAQSDLGPLITAQAVNDMKAFIADATEKGATIESTQHQPDKGNYFPATVISNVPTSAKVFSEEIFGPIAPLFKFEDDEEAIAMANDTEFGLAAYIYTGSQSRCWKISEAIEYGMVGVNEVAITSDAIPFGGVKESGLGREGSKYGIDEYTEIKYICMGGL